MLIDIGIEFLRGFSTPFPRARGIGEVDATICWRVERTTRKFLRFVILDFEDFIFIANDGLLCESNNGYFIVKIIGIFWIRVKCGSVEKF